MRLNVARAKLGTCGGEQAEHFEPRLVAKGFEEARVRLGGARARLDPRRAARLTRTLRQLRQLLGHRAGAYACIEKCQFSKGTSSRSTGRAPPRARPRPGPRARRGAGHRRRPSSASRGARRAPPRARAVERGRARRPPPRARRQAERRRPRRAGRGGRAPPRARPCPGWSSVTTCLRPSRAPPAASSGSSWSPVLAAAVEVVGRHLVLAAPGSVELVDHLDALRPRPPRRTRLTACGAA